MRTVSKVKRSRPVKSDLQVRREDAGLSMRDLAKYTGISHATLCRLEAGRPPDIRNALLLAKFYECTVENLFFQFATSPSKGARE